MKIQFAIMVYVAAFTSFLTAQDFPTEMFNGTYYEEGNSAADILEKIKDGNFIHKTGENRNMPFHFAAIHDRVDVAELLLKLDPRLINIWNNHWQTALCLAVGNEKEEMVKFLLGREKTIKIINKKTRSGEAPLHIAAKKGYAAIAGLLCDYGADIELSTGVIRIGGTPLHLAADFNKPNVMKVLLANGANIKNVTKRACCDEFSQFEEVWKLLGCQEEEED